MGARADALLPGPAWIRALYAFTALLVLGYLVWTLPGVRPSPAFDVRFDAVLQGSCYGLVAVLCVLRPLLFGRTRLGWWVLAGAVTLRALGFVVALVRISEKDPLPFPSIADACWVGSSVLLLVSVVLWMRALAPRISLLLALDALGTALAVAAGAVWVLTSPVGTLVESGTPRAAVVVNLVYPILDSALLVAVVSVLAVVGRRVVPAQLMLVVGLVSFALVDVVYLVRLAAGTWRPGSLLASFSLIATAIIGYAPWLAPLTAPVRRRRVVGEPRAAVPRPPIVVPLALAGVSVVAFMVDAFHELPKLAMLLFASVVVVAAVRGVLDLLGGRREAGEVLGETAADLRRFKALVEASTDYIAIARPDGRFLYLNPGGRRLVGLDPDVDITAMRVPDLLPPAVHGFWESVRLPAILQQGRWEGEGRLRHVGGEADVPVATSAFLIEDTEGYEPLTMATIQRDITARLNAEIAVSNLADQRQLLLNRLVQAQEDERARIAADVHDDSVQALAAVELRLSLLRRQVESDAPHLSATIEGVTDTVAAATARLRNLLFDLESPARQGRLDDAVNQAAAFVFEDTEVRWRVTGDLPVEVPEATRVTAYRLAKEALINARRHADARQVLVDLAHEDGGIVVSVRDDGRGIAADAMRERPGHLGLSSMRDRTVVAGGRLEIGPRDGGGTEVRAWLPVDPEQHAGRHGAAQE